MADVINQVNGRVQIIFERGESGQIFRDAIWMLQAEYDTTPAETIQALQDERYANWLAIVNPPPQE